jgi:uncharacterized protein (TIGR02246 family)
MKRLSCVITLLVLFGMAPAAWAGPAEEIAEIGRERAKAYRAGNLDAWMLAFADDAVFQSGLVPFRLDGKEAIRAHYAALFERYPTRSTAARQRMVRVYGPDTTVVTNNYSHVTYVDRAGQVINHFFRVSVIWVKVGGQWRIVDQHVSRLPQ